MARDRAACVARQAAVSRHWRGALGPRLGVQSARGARRRACVGCAGGHAEQTEACH